MTSTLIDNILYFSAHKINQLSFNSCNSPFYLVHDYFISTWPKQILGTEISRQTRKMKLAACSPDSFIDYVVVVVHPKDELLLLLQAIVHRLNHPPQCPRCMRTIYSLWELLHAQFNNGYQSFLGEAAPTSNSWNPQIPLVSLRVSRISIESHGEWFMPS